MAKKDKPGYLVGGWKEKYQIKKVDGSPVDPEAMYFVLRLDKDPCARIAMAAYAEAVGNVGNREFANDIRSKLAHARGKAVLSGNNPAWRRR